MVNPLPAEYKDTKLTAGQIKQWAVSAGGWTGDALTIITAVGLAESGGRIGAIGGPNLDGSYDYGIWQINSVHADLFTKYPSWWSGSNALMAKEIYQGAGNKFTPWSAYNNGAYLVHMGEAAAAVSSPGDIGGGPSAVITTSPLDSIGKSVAAVGQAFSSTASWLGNGHNWVRVAMVIVGGALVVGALGVTAGKPLVATAGKVMGAVK